MSRSELPKASLSDRDRRRVKQLAALPVALALAAYLGQILAGALIDSQPLILISLNATDPMLLLAASQTGSVAFLVVGAVRLFAPDMFLHQLGWEFGPATKNYISGEFGSNSGLLKTINLLERWFPRIGWLLLFLVPGYPMCLLAGIARMKRIPFVAVNLAGTLSRLLLIYWVSSVFDGPIGAIVRFISRFSLPFTLVMVLLVVFQSGRNKERPTEA